MGDLLFRSIQPSRTYTDAELSDYKRYKKHLAQDFNNRCGYTDCPHFWFGGMRTFQIDHFKPLSIFPDLVTKYSNLVYTCSYVNRAKSNDTGDYIDPCETDYNQHFYRDGNGNIYPFSSSKSAVYMHRKLKLYLKRYSIIYMLDQLENKMEKMRTLIVKTNNQEAKELFQEITFKYMDYIKYLRAEQ